jgi:2-oxo-4-hydroxy-4-carboxy--5-ureidoimidazoline (OHCU) decarboxylase
MFFFKISVTNPDELNKELKFEYEQLKESEFIYWNFSDDLSQQKIELLKRHPSVSISKELELTGDLVTDKNTIFIYFITNLIDVEPLFKNRHKIDFEYSDDLLKFPFVTSLNGKNSENILKLMAGQQLEIIYSKIKNKIELIQDIISFNISKNIRFMRLLNNYMRYLGEYLEIADYNMFKSNYQHVGINTNKKKYIKDGSNFDLTGYDEKSIFSVLHNLFVFLGINIVDELTIVHYYVEQKGEL